MCPPGEQRAASQDACIRDLCGNGIVDAGEACDDGNIQGGDGCSSDCTSAETCGNGILDLVAGEECDTSGTEDSPTCDMSGAHPCRRPRCGDGHVNAAAGEQCESGGVDTVDCDGSTCTTPSCGDGHVNRAAGEECDTGGTTDAGACNMALGAGGSRCRIARCGDGYANAAAGEQCDTGGADSVTCNGKTCQTPSCGDGYVNAAAGEQCDTGGTVDSVACNMAPGAGANRCHAARCGDGWVNADAGEQCDDGGETATCNANCRVSICGDGYVNRAAGESCDTAGASATCNANCSVSRCGDGILNLAAGEQCDTGGVDANGCIGATCRLSCGNGVVDAGEVCDDGNTSCGSCNSTCTAVTAGPATGTIFPVAGSSLTDGATFTISDGVNPPKIFELDSDGVHGATHVAVPYTSADPAATVAASIVAAVNSAGTLDVRASGPFASPDGSPFVALANTRLGAVGNQPIVETVPSADFTVSGMGGGGGYDCASGQACRSNQDCQSGECLANVCL